ncbi:MAG: c-type cytochrome, partial [Deltaproteobacteria bacterium]|nr:c-type cytochrome [Deltaproteobacteria bacterium]
MVRSYSPLIFIFTSVLVLLSSLTGFSAEPPRRPKIPEPISPIFPTPGAPGILPKGDPQRGERIYQSWGCPSCHTLDSKGGKVGPDLARVGEIHTDPYWFRRYLSDPRSIIPNSV